MTELPAYDPARLRRASVLAVQCIGPRRYVVRGQDEPFYTVTLACDPPCECADYYHRGGPSNPCKHVLAARLQEREPALVEALAEMKFRELRAEQAMEETP